MKYRGFWESANSKPKNGWVQIWASDWNKDHWGFYAYIDTDNYSADIKEIQDLITKLNFRDGDVYIELINHSENQEAFYNQLMSNNFDTWYGLSTETWEKIT